MVDIVRVNSLARDAKISEMDPEKSLSHERAARLLGDDSDRLLLLSLDWLRFTCLVRGNCEGPSDEKNTF